MSSTATTEPKAPSTVPTDGTKSSRPAPFAEAHQQFLVGETLYLRPLEPSDAKHPNAWRASPYPINAQKAEELIKKDLESKDAYRTVRLLACRRDDDRPVGVATYSTWNWLNGDVSVYAEPTFGEAADCYKAEMLTLLVPWLLDERDLMAVWLNVAASERTVIEAAGKIGMHQAASLREALWLNGRREDQLAFEGLNRHWQDRLGTPEPGVTVAGAPDDPLSLIHI